MVVFLLNLCSWYLKIKKCKTTEKIFENNFMQAFLFIFFCSLTTVHFILTKFQKAR